MSDSETPIQVDGKIVAVVPGKIVKAVAVPGRLVNLLTEQPEPEPQQPTVISTRIEELEHPT